MTNQIQIFRGRVMRHASHYILMGLLLAGSGWASTALAAGTTLKNISYEALPGGNVELKMDFGTGPVPQPKIFTTGTPPRIAVDFADTDNASARHIDIGKGSTSGVSAVTAGGRTRVVVELTRESTYRTRVEGHSLLLTINNGSSDQAITTVAMVDPSKALPSSMNGPTISNIDFRRGSNGEGRVVISFSGDGANEQMTHTGDMVDVNIDHARLPANLAQRLDTLDFATPVQSIVTKAGVGGGAHIQIAVTGNINTSAYQTPGQYIVEVAPRKADAKPDALSKANQQPVYTGKRATFNFQDIPVRSALQLIADESGLNLVASDSVTGGVTLRLDNVPWDQALDVILRAKSLDKRRDGNVVWIAPQAELAKYEQDIADAKLKAEDTAELITDYVPISYGKASDIAKLLTTGSLQASGGGTSSSSQHGFLSNRGSVSFDVRTNTLLLNDTPEKIKQLHELIAVLDKPVQQVLIESRLVVANDSFERDLGAKFGISGRQNNTAFANSTAAGTALASGTGGGNVVSIGGSDNGNGTASGLNVNLPAATSAGSFGLAILGANYAVDLELQAAQTEGRSEVISSPRVITANQQEADIRQGQEIGYVTYQNSTGSTAGSGTATVQFKDAVLELKVTPTITADNRVYLLINVTKDALAGYITVPGSGQVPTINTSSVNTSALVDNGQTVVLGGIYEINNSDSTVKVPGLGDIPILGALFRSSSRTSSKAELLIFVTPRILSETLQ